MEGIDNFIQRIESIPQYKESTPQQKPSPEVGWLDRNYRTSKELDAKDKDTDISLKKIYGWSIIGVLGVWELFVIGFCFIQVCCPNAKEISDAVFITLLTCHGKYSDLADDRTELLIPERKELEITVSKIYKTRCNYGKHEN